MLRSRNILRIMVPMTLCATQELATKLENTRIEVDWRWRQLDKICADVDRKNNYQVEPDHQHGPEHVPASRSERSESLLLD